MTIAVTGADGFIGESLCAMLERRGRPVTRIVRRERGPGETRKLIPDLSRPDALELALNGVEVVIHLAARVHVLRETEADPMTAFRRANVDATVRLAKAAIHTGVRRLVFVSSIGVNGNHTDGRPFAESDVPAPAGPYAQSKLEAERALQAIAGGSSLEIVNVRPALVYGPGVKGNFLRLISLAQSGLPLPLASVTNRRSLIGVENLSELLVLCAENPAAAGQTYLAAEGEVHSTPGLLRAIAKALGCRSRLFRFPPAALRFSARIAGRESQFDKICGSLEVSAAKIRQSVGWKPRLGFDEGIARTAEWFGERRHGPD